MSRYLNNTFSLTNKSTVYYTAIVMLATLLLACNTESSNAGYGMQHNATNQVSTPASSTAKTPLTQVEREGILLMREEEKLAYDVYLTLYARWQMPIFANISTSEKRHMDSMGRLIANYQLQDPITTTDTGVFTNPALQKLYHELVAQGSQSYVAALKVGATIEDLDIADLMKLNAATERADIKMVYDNLTKGSRNHLRAFTSALQQAGEHYQPQYLNEVLYQQIISTPKETGRSH